MKYPNLTLTALFAALFFSLVSMAQPVASFTIPGSNGYCKGTTLTFTNTSTGATVYRWHFGGGTGDTSVLASPSKTFVTGGNFIVTLKAINGPDTSVTMKAVYIKELPLTDMTIFSKWGDTYDFIEKDTLTFTTSLTNTASVKWSVLQTVSTQQALPFAFDSVGSKSIKLTKYTGCGDSVVVLRTITIKPKTPGRPAQVSPTIVCPGFPVNYSVLNSNRYGSYKWIFDNGDEVTDKETVKRVYLTKGEHIARLVHYVGSSTDTTAYKVLVTDTVVAKPYINSGLYVTPMVYDFNKKQNRYMTCVGSPFSFTTNNLQYYSLINKRWILPGGVTLHASDTSYIFTAIGDYTVYFGYDSYCGFKDSIPFSVSVKSADSVVAYTHIKGYKPTLYCNTRSTVDTVCPGQRSYFTAGVNADIRWVFPDGSVVNARTSDKVFTVPGVYKVKGLALMECGDVSDTGVVTVVVSTKARPASDFTIEEVANIQPNGCGKTTVRLNVNKSPQRDMQRHYWYFGDGGMDTTLQPTHRYETPGLYTVIHEAISYCGTSSRSVLTVNAGAGATPLLFSQIRGNRFCVMDSVLIQTGSVQCDSLVAYTGDGMVFTKTIGVKQTQTSFVYFYPAPGTYRIRVYGYLKCNQVDSFTQDIDVFPPPTAIIASGDTTVRAGDTVALTASSAGVLRKYWTCGNLFVDTAATLRYAFATPGVYTVYLLVSNATACFAVDSVNITVTLHNGLVDRGDNRLQAHLYPNPASTRLTVELANREATACKLEVFDLAGKVQLSHTEQVAAGNPTVTVQIESLPPGIYLVRLQTQQGIRTLKFIKQ